MSQIGLDPGRWSAFLRARNIDNARPAREGKGNDTAAMRETLDTVNQLLSSARESLMRDAAFEHRLQKAQQQRQQILGG